MPPTLPDPVDTIERFAELSALLDDPFAEEDEVLRAAGLDAEAWEAIQARWVGELRGGSGDVEDLARRFGKMYRETTARITGRAAAGEPMPDTLPTGAPPPDPEAAPEATLELGAVLPLPALPFAPRAEQAGKP
jgi:hypothetical protein